MLIYFDIFDINRSLWISFRLKSIDFNLFDIIRTCFNQFLCDEIKSGFKCGSKKSIKSRFNHDIFQFGDLDGLHRLSLLSTVEPCYPTNYFRDEQTCTPCYRCYSSLLVHFNTT